MVGLFSRLRWRFSGSAPQAEIARTVPADTRVYAIGDIHGRADLLIDLRQQIVVDASRVECPSKKIVVYLGDYVDRGLDSKGVIDLLLQPLDGFESVHLKGNHEDSLLKYLDDYTQGNRWFPIGGDATVVSYGVRVPKGLSPTEREAHLWSEFQQKFPNEHLAFLNSLGHMYRAGNYAFVHAGVLPGMPLEDQDPTDLMWIRKRFLENQSDFGAVIVHGHSTAREPEVRNNRIGIDTGAYATNVLTCLVLEGSSHRFLTTGL